MLITVVIFAMLVIAVAYISFNAGAVKVCNNMGAKVSTKYYCVWPEEDDPWQDLNDYLTQNKEKYNNSVQL